MKTYIEKKVRACKIYVAVVLAVICVLIGLFVVQTIRGAEPEIAVAFSALFMFVLFLGFIIYASVFHPFVSNILWLKKWDCTGIADDIDIAHPTYPDAQVFCGRNAFFCRKNGLILPYSMIAWVHLYERTAYGVITVQKCFKFYTTDGKCYSAKLSTEQVQQLLQSYILPRSPKLIVGYGREQQQRYKALRKDYKKTYGA